MNPTQQRFMDEQEKAIQLANTRVMNLKRSYGIVRRSGDPDKAREIEIELAAAKSDLNKMYIKSRGL